MSTDVGCVEVDCQNDKLLDVNSSIYSLSRLYVDWVFSKIKEFLGSQVAFMVELLITW